MFEQYRGRSASTLSVASHHGHDWVCVHYISCTELAILGCTIIML